MANNGSVYLNTEIQFDPSSEAYMVQEVKELAYHRSLSDQIERLLKLSADNPECLDRPDVLRAALRQMEMTGLTPRAKQFYDSATQEIKEIKARVNEIYDMCLKMYTTAEFANVIGLKEQTKNIARAEFILEMQVNRICQTMKIPDYTAFKSGSYFDLDSKSASIMEYIVSHYSTIVDSYKSEIAESSHKVDYSELANLLAGLVNKQQIETVDVPSRQALKTEEKEVVTVEDSSRANRADIIHSQTELSGVSSVEELKDKLSSLDVGETLDFGDTVVGKAYDNDVNLELSSKMLGL